MNRLLFIIFTVLVGLDVAFGVSLVRIWPGVLVMHFLDVGQGDAVLIVTPEGNRILVDGGPGNAVLSEIAGVLPVGSSRIDLVVLTHPHADHMEGLIYVLDRFEVGAVLVSLPESSGAMYSAFLSRLKGREVYLAESSTDFKFGGTLIDVLYPFEPVGTIENLNNASVVMRVSSGEARILLTGDAEMEVEGDLAGEDLEADLMKAGHHGSRTANTKEFLEEASAKVMVISVSEENSFGHPHVETLERAEAFGIRVLRTDLDGRVSFVFGEKELLRSIFLPRWRVFGEV